MVDSVVLYWLNKLRSLCEETPERREFVCVSHAASGIGNGWQFDYMDAAREHIYGHMEGKLNANRILEFLKGLFCLAVISHALCYLKQQDTRDTTRVTGSPIPLLCYNRMAGLDDWPDMTRLICELAEHIQLASEPEWENADLAFARLLCEQSQMVFFVSREEIERALEITLK